MKNYQTLALACLSLLIACQTKTKAQQVVKDDKYQGIELLINVDNFKGEECLQAVSPMVYQTIIVSEKDQFISDAAYVRHHSLNLMKIGRCDNVVLMTDEKAKQYIYCCGGHTSAER
jgi:hypothetical protein